MKMGREDWKIGNHIVNIHPSELLSTKTKESKINKQYKKKKKVLYNNKI